MRSHLRQSGVPENRLLTFNMESMEFDGLDYRQLYNLVRRRTAGVDHPYLFFDELHEVEEWERVINSLRVDSGLQNYLQGYRDAYQGRVFENMVYQQLVYEGCDVSIGKLRNGKVDFVARRNDLTMYIQVTEDMTAPETMERELKPLLPFATPTRRR